MSLLVLRIKSLAMSFKFIFIVLLSCITVSGCSDNKLSNEDDKAGLNESYKKGYEKGYDQGDKDADATAGNKPLARYKGLYVDNFSQILGDSLLENELLTYARDSGFTTLSLYGLQAILKENTITETITQQLSNFIFKAKTNYSIKCITAVGECADFFRNVISVYNHFRPLKHQRIDACNLEFEFWNYVAIGGEGQENYCTYYLKKSGEKCDVKGAYNYYIQQLSEIHKLATADSCLCETYVGYVDAHQAKEIAALVDRVLIHAYVLIPFTTYDDSYERLSFFGGTKDTTNIILIFSSEPKFMGNWLKNHEESTVFKTYVGLYNIIKNHFKLHLNLIGYQWFVYSDMPKMQFGKK